MKQAKWRMIFVFMLVTGSIFFMLPDTSIAGQRLSVKVSIANMRSYPGTGDEDEVMWQVERHHPFVVVETKGDWYKVRDFENDVAWIYKKLLGDVPTVITIKDKCNVRSEGSKKGRVLFTVARGIPFRVLRTKGSWIKIQHADNDTGWIHKSLVW